MHTAFRLFTLLCALFSAVQAVSVGKGLVRIDDRNFGIFQTDIPLNLTDSKLSVGFTLLETKGDEGSMVFPKQVTVALSAENIASEIYLYANLLEGKVYEANTPIRGLSDYILSQEKIDISIITGDPSSDSSLNRIIKAGSILPSEKLRADRLAKGSPTRFGEKDEIHHVFRTPEKTVYTLVTVQFVFTTLILLVVLILAWAFFDSANIDNVSSFSPLSLLFLVSIFTFEYYFVDYYLGASIFDSLYRFAITGAFAIYLGSKALSDMYKLRMQKKRE